MSIDMKVKCILSIRMQVIAMQEVEDDEGLQSKMMVVSLRSTLTLILFRMSFYRNLTWTDDTPASYTLHHATDQSESLQATLILSWYANNMRDMSLQQWMT